MRKTVREYQYQQKKWGKRINQLKKSKSPLQDGTQNELIYAICEKKIMHRTRKTVQHNNRQWKCSGRLEREHINKNTQKLRGEKEAKKIWGIRLMNSTLIRSTIDIIFR